MATSSNSTTATGSGTAASDQATNPATPARKRSAGGVGQSNWIDPATLMRIKNLQVRARVVVEGFFSGLHRSPYHGFSVEFSEYRQYTPGDDLRYLDWRLYARSDRYYIKRFEDETNVRCHLLLDLSNSMGFSSIDYTKADYARTTAATLAYFLSRQRDAVGLLTFADRIQEYLPARYRPGHMHRLMVLLERAVSGQSTDLSAPVEQLARTLSKRGLIIYISDMLGPLDDLKQKLAYLTTRGHEVVVFRVLDPAELSFNFTAPTMFVDAETQRQIYVDPDSARADYQRLFGEHNDALEKTCAELGIDYYPVSTERPLELTLFDFLHARMRRGKRPVRRHSPVGRSSG